MLSEKEIHKIFSWLPYRESWPINLDETADNINTYYGELINAFLNNRIYNCVQWETGGMSNYIDFLCYRKGDRIFDGKAIMVMVNLCAPIAAYGVTDLIVRDTSRSNNGLTPEKVGIIDRSELQEIEIEVIRILKDAQLEVIDHEFASRILPAEVFEALDLKFSNKYLYGLFQMAS
jgi:hypothetical protein